MEPIVYRVATTEDAEDLINSMNTKLEFHEESYKGIKYIIENNIKDDFPRFSIETHTGVTYLITIQIDFLLDVIDNFLDFLVEKEMYEKAEEVKNYRKTTEKFIEQLNATDEK